MKSGAARQTVGCRALLLLACCNAVACAAATPQAATPQAATPQAATPQAATPIVPVDSTTSPPTPEPSPPKPTRVHDLLSAQELCQAVSASAQRELCDVLSRADQALVQGQIERAERDLVAQLGRPLIELAGARTQPPTGEVNWLTDYVMARALMHKGSLSYGQGDEHNRAAHRLLLQLKSTAGPPQYADSLTLELGRSHLSLGEGSQALTLITPLAHSFQGDPEVQATLGIALLSTGQVQQSLAPLEKAQALEPNEPERKLVLGTARMLSGDLEGAEKSFRGALFSITQQKNGAQEDSELLARAYGDLGAVLLVQGEAAAGKSYLQKARQLAPKRATYAANLAYAELLLEHPEQAEAEARRAIELDPRLVSAWINLGLALAKRNQYDAARDAFEHAAALDPDDPRPRDNLRDLEELRQQ